MKLHAMAAVVGLACALPLAALAQNITTVNGKPVPKARVTTLLEQASRSGQPVSPDMEARARDEVVMREIFVQQADKEGIAATPAFKAQMELARQTILIRELFSAYQKKHPVTDEQAKAEYEKLKKENSGTEYRARHILVEAEDEAKKLLAEIKAGGNFEELAKKNSKDPGSAENGGDLDFAKPETYVPEFGQAITKLKKGEVTPEPIKTQFGWHIIKLEDSREATFPPYEEVQAQIKQRIAQQNLQAYQEQLKKNAKTDYKFGDGQAH